MSRKKKADTRFGGSLKELEAFEDPSLPGVKKRIVFGPGRFWEEYVVRHFTIEPGAETPFHSHKWPHYIIILEGCAEGFLMGERHRLPAGSWAYAPSATEHVFRNTGNSNLSFLCIVPRHGDPDATSEGFLDRSSKNVPGEESPCGKPGKGREPSPG